MKEIEEEKIEEIEEIEVMEEEKIEAMEEKAALKITLEQIRAYKLLKMEEELETMEDSNYKKSQLALKIREKKSKWFPNFVWDSKKSKTFIKENKNSNI